MPAEGQRCLEDRGIHIPEFYTTHSWAVPRSVERQAWSSPSAKSVWHFAFFFPSFVSFFIYDCCRNATLSHSVAKKKKHQFNAWNTLSPELLELVGSRRTCFAQIFFTSPRSFWIFDVTRNKENNNSGLECMARNASYFATNWPTSQSNECREKKLKNGAGQNTAFFTWEPRSPSWRTIM